MAIIPICAKTGEGLDQLAGLLDEMFENQLPCDGSILTNARQFDALEAAVIDAGNMNERENEQRNPGCIISICSMMAMP